MFGFRVGNYRLVIIKLKYSRENLVFDKKKCDIMKIKW